MKKILSLVLAFIMTISIFNGVSLSALAEETSVSLEETMVYEEISEDIIEEPSEFSEESSELSVELSEEASEEIIIENSEENSVETSEETIMLLSGDIVASGTCGDNLTWTLDEDGLLTISGTGEMTNYAYYSSVPWYNYRNTVKSVDIKDGVTSIGNRAFYEFISLRSIKIPNSVISIGESSFECCESLLQVKISEGMVNIGKYAFYGCDFLLSVEIPKTVTYIGERAFSSCDSLEIITVVKGNKIYRSEGNCIIEINTNKLIVGCKNSIIPNYVTSIANYAFAYCQISVSIKIPDSVTSIGIGAFTNCDFLRRVELSDSITYISSNAFSNCDALTDIIIPSSVRIIGVGAFKGCEALAEVYYYGTKEKWNAISISSNNSTLNNAIINYNYSGELCNVIASGNCGENLTWILDYDGVLTISGTGEMEDFARYDSVPWYTYRKSIKELYIDSGVTSIDNYAFLDCRELENIVVDNGNTVFHSEGNCIIHTETSGVVLGCKNSIIPNYIKLIYSYAFNNCSSLISIKIPNGVIDIGYNAFQGCTHLLSIDIPNSVTSIDGGAFMNCLSLTKIKIPNGITRLESYTFEYCYSLTSIEISNSVTYIGLNTFSGCKSLTSIEIPDSVESIYGRAFAGTSITSIMIPSSVKYIYDNPFVGCKYLEEIIVSSDNEKFHSNGNCIIYTKSNSLKLGCNNSAIPNYVTSISAHAFEQCHSLVSIVIPKSVTWIGEFAFWECSSLTAVEIPDSVTRIDKSAFSGWDYGSLVDVYYTGTREQWYNIYVGSNNKYFTNATIHFNSSKNKFSFNTKDGNFYTFLDETQLSNTSNIVFGDSNLSFTHDEYTVNDILFRSLDESIITITGVSATGTEGNYCLKVDAKKTGRTTITATLPNGKSIYAGVVVSKKFAFNAKDGNFYSFSGNTGLSNTEDIVFGDKNLKFIHNEYTTDDIVFESLDEEIIEINGVVGAGTEGYYSLKVAAKKKGETTITATLPDGTSISAGVVVKKNNVIELTTEYSPEYLYYSKTFLSNNNDMTTTPEIFVGLTNKPIYSLDYSNDEGKTSLHDVKIHATVSGSNMSFDKTFYQNTYESMMEELKINESLADLLLLYPYNVNNNTFETKKTFNVTLTITAKELSEPHTETVSFSVENYPDIVDSHLDFINNNATYKELKNNDAVVYANAVKDTWDYGWNNAVFNFVSIDNLLGFNNPYDLVIADVLSEFLGAERYQEFGMALLFKNFSQTYESVLTSTWEACSEIQDFTSGIIDVVDKMAKDEYFDKDLKIKPNAIEKLWKSSKYKTMESLSLFDYADGDLYTHISMKMVNSRSVQDKIDNAFALADKGGQAWNFATTGVNIANDIVKGINYTSVLNAYCDADHTSKQAVLIVLNRVYNDGSASQRLKSALERYVLTETDFGEIASKVEIALQSTAEACWDIYKGLFSAQIGSILWQSIGSISFMYNGASMTVATCPVTQGVGGALAGWSAGKVVSDLLCDSSDKASEMKKVVILGELAQYAGQALEICESILRSNPTEENIEYYERMFELFKIIQTQSITRLQKVNEIKAYSLIERIFTDHDKTVVQINWDLECEKQSYANLRCHGSLSEAIASLSPFVSSTKVIEIKCPVNVSLYSLEDELLVQIVDNEVVFNAIGAVATVFDDAKYIIVPADREFKVKLTANDSGTMTYSVSEFDQGEMVRKINFNDISLYEGQVFDAYVESGYEVSENSYALYTTGQNAIKEVIPYDESISGSQLKSLSVNVTCVGNGSARGVEAATSGDYVVVMATPDDGYDFTGWYDAAGNLVSEDENYGFIIKENTKLTAKFGDLYTPPIIGGYTYSISGNIKAYGDASKDVTVELLSGEEVVDTRTVTGNSGTYAFEKPAGGTYTVRVSKTKHATREYEVTVDETDVTQDVTIWLYGDVNTDGSVNGADTLQINRRVANMSSAFNMATDTDYRLKVANVTNIALNDTLINAADTLQINRKVANLTSVFDKIA